MRKLGLVLVLCNVLWFAACGSGNGSGGNNPPPPPVTNNVQPISVDAGPQPQSFLSSNIAFTNVTICVPGTSSCQTIDHVQVDTGSQGLRLLQGVVTLNLPPQNVSGRPLAECLSFADGFVWGTVAVADIQLAGETAPSSQVQIIVPSTGSPAVPNTCTGPPGGNGNEGDNAMALGANGIIGVGLFQEDCGGYCVSQGSSCDGSTNPCVYYTCSSSSVCSPVNVPLNQQVPNPVALFASDNNGVLIQLPAVPNGGSPAVNGSLVLRHWNAVEQRARERYRPCWCLIPAIMPGISSPPSTDNRTPKASSTAVPMGTSSWTRTPRAYLPARDKIPVGIAQTPRLSLLVRPNQGQNASGAAVGPTSQVNFTVEDANSLFSGSNTAFSTLGGPLPGQFDWGLPFFYGRNVYTAIEGASTPGGTGPYFAY